MPRSARFVVLVALVLGGSVGLVDTASAATARSVSLVVPATAVTGTTVTMSGSLSKSPLGSTVQIQRRSGLSWITDKTVRTVSNGRYSAPVLVTKTGDITYRAYAPRTSKLAAAASSWRHVQVLKTFTSAPTPRIDGVPEVGQTLTLVPGSWSPTPQLRYRWLRGGTPIAGATGKTYGVTAADLGALISAEVTGTRSGYATKTVVSAATSAVQRHVTTFGELMKPASARIASTSGASVTPLDHAPAWADTELVRWDTPGAFTHSLDPKPALTMFSANYGQDVSSPALGAEYNTGNITLQNADVSFVATGRKFAIRYLTSQSSDAMVWLDGAPVSADPIIGTDAGGYGQFNWVQVELPEAKTVRVRFAGPTIFTGVDIDQSDPTKISAAPTPFTIGIVADSYYDSSTTPNSYTSSAAALLHTKTGFRVWDMAQYGTGYLNDASAPAMNGMVGHPGYYASPFGSDQRIARVAAAPIDALVVNGSINDNLLFSPAQHLAAVEAYVDRVAAVRPDLPIVLVGIEPVQQGRAATAEEKADFDAKTQNLRSMVGRNNVVGFIDPYTEHWLTGTGSVTSPKGDGNQDQYIGPDGVHLTATGQNYYQDLIKERLADLPASLPKS